MTRSRYHTPSVPPSTAWARHLDAVARAEGLSQSGMFRKLREAVGLGRESRSAFLPYLVDKEPDETQAKALAAIVGWPAEPEPETNEIVGTPVDPVVEAIHEQTKAITALVGELRAERIARIGGLELIVAGLLDGSLLPGSGGAALQELRARREKAE